MHCQDEDFIPRHSARPSLEGQRPAVARKPLVYTRQLAVMSNALLFNLEQKVNELSSWLVGLALLLLLLPGHGGVGVSAAEAPRPFIAGTSKPGPLPGGQHSPSPELTGMPLELPETPPQPTSWSASLYEEGSDSFAYVLQAADSTSLICSMEQQPVAPGFSELVAVPRIRNETFPSDFSLPLSYVGTDCGCWSSPYNFVFGADTVIQNRKLYTFRLNVQPLSQPDLAIRGPPSTLVLQLDGLDGKVWFRPTVPWVGADIMGIPVSASGGEY
ncbi:hypothetical protein VOLCADRAFT_92886 [Volvox carteri f. nagariensis]|uniref:Uncharacterized protein n=1 Tax=Volvox carteri f. nagariensis TaxID=3068 RepID=D8U0Q5_VOLCA|nr:uncharacterized protein VOLCADRAFT_92886 [Volvox carteri f. nagariensis]EFJ46679.1 hypothetical protein VOLCADRAFT_92886 [Volvox carteri f. nagariensis]|eukprot:XP_002952208.1 hypothetical protein VOLCADRAFT_92886 [Volvox carteri f. nagariensis]